MVIPVGVSARCLLLTGDAVSRRRQRGMAVAGARRAVRRGHIPMSAPFWFMAGLLAGAAAMLGAVLLWRVAHATIRRRGLLFAGSLAAVTLLAGISFAVGSRQGEAIAPGEAATNGSQTAAMPPPSAMPAESPMPSAAMMAQVLAMPRNGRAGSAEPMEEAAAKLATRLERGGGSAADWNLLAQAYDFLGRPDDARRARARAAQATNQRNP